MRIRDATPDDAPAVRAVHRASIEGLGARSYDAEQVEAWARGCASTDYAGAIDAEGVAYVVAVRDAADDGDVVGFGSLSLAPPDGYESAVDAEVTGVYVHPSAAREGVGTGLYEELERRARDEGVERLGLLASRNAVPFYEAHGFDRVTEHTHEFSSHEDTGVTGVVVEMVTEL